MDCVEPQVGIFNWTFFST